MLLQHHEQQDGLSKRSDSRDPGRPGFGGIQYCANQQPWSPCSCKEEGVEESLAPGGSSKAAFTVLW